MSDITLDTISYEVDLYENEQDLNTTSSWLGREITLEEGTSVNAFAEGILASRNKNNDVNTDIGGRLQVDWGDKEMKVTLNGYLEASKKNGPYAKMTFEHDLSTHKGNACLDVGKKNPR